MDPTDTLKKVVLYVQYSLIHSTNGINVLKII